jgi:Tfp pilus assembly protein PilN
MSQQINLATPILLTQKRYFSAHTIVIALGLFLVVGGGLFGAWVWNLERGTAAFKESIATQGRELESLQAVIQRSKANAAPVDPALLAQLQQLRNTIAQREKLQIALQEGMFRPGWGHSDRLTWVARSIPDPVWITDVKMDGSRFEVSGFTLEPSALNDWVEKLALSPLMQGLKLASVKVENASATATATAALAPVAATPSPALPASSTRAVWSFSLVSIEPPPVAAPASAAGGKP